MRRYLCIFAAISFLTSGMPAWGQGETGPLEALPALPDRAVESPASRLATGGSPAGEVRLLDPADPAGHPAVSRDRAAPEALPDAYLVQGDGVLSVSATEGLLTGV